jgi:CheY-like chemotaxis protein
LFRDGLRHVLTSQPDLEVVGEAGNAAEALERVGELRPDVVLMDIGMPGMSSFEAARMMEKNFPGTRLIFITMYEDEEYLLQCLDVGAAGYLLKDAPAPHLIEAVREVPHLGLTVLIGGPTAQLADANHTLRDYGYFAAVVVIGWNFVMLLFAFRSVVVPIKAVLMNVLSLGASYGLLVWIFQQGHLAGLLGFTPLEGIDPTIPLIMFAVVFGLSMDYEVFLLSRIREEWLHSGDNHQSVLAGLAHTGRIITSAALIMLVVIGSFAAGTLVYVKQMGVGIGVAIALDVTLVRALLVPATMQLLGAWNWWLPRWLKLPGVETPASELETP